MNICAWLQIPLRHNELLRFGCIYRSPSSDLKTSTEHLCNLILLLNHVFVYWFVVILIMLICVRSTSMEVTSDPHAQHFLDTLAMTYLCINM